MEKIDFLKVATDAAEVGAHLPARRTAGGEHQSQ